MTTADYLMQPSAPSPSASAAPRKKQSKSKQQTSQPAATPPVVPGRQGEGIYDPKSANYASPAPVEGIDYKVVDGKNVPLAQQTQNDDLPQPPEAKRIDTDEAMRYRKPDPVKQAPQPAPQAPSTPYQNLVRMLYPEQEAQRYKEEQAKIERKRKRDAAISALGDGIAALSNLYTVSRGAQNIDVSSNTMSDKSRERYDKINAERDARKDAYRNAMLNAAMRDRAEQIDADRAALTNTLAAQQQAEQTRQFEETMRYNRERDKLNYGTRLSVAQISANARQYAADKAAFAKKYAADHKSGKASGNYYEIPIYDETTGELRYIRVTGNEASKYYQNMTQADNETKHTDARGRESTTQKGNTSAQNNAQKAAKKVREANAAKQAQSHSAKDFTLR